MPQPSGSIAGPLTPEGLPAYLLRRGGSGLVVSMPHVGTAVPAALAARMTPALIEYVKANPRWQVSLQTHKYLDIP